MNVITLSGNLTKDVEFYNKNGTDFAESNIAVNNYFYDKNGEKRSDKMFIKIVFIGSVAVEAKKRLQKSQRLSLMGELKSSSWYDENDNRRTTYYIVVREFDAGCLPKSRQFDEEVEN